MAVSAPVEKIPKSEPDVTKLNTFAGHTVTVTKHVQPRGSVGQTVVPTTEMPLKQILGLVTQLPLQHGPGFYRFTVADTGGTGDDVWLSRLGPDTGPAQAQDGGFPNMATPTDQQPNNTPPSAGVRHLGRGFYFDPEMGVLTTPWGAGVNWRPGDPFPTPPTSTQPAHLASVPPNATPWSWQGPQQQGGWGGWGNIPVDSGDSARVKQLEQQIAEQNRQREMDTLRAEMQRQAEDMQKSFALLVDKLTARPSGPTESELRLQAELADTRRRQEESDRRAEESRREADRRSEDQRREDQRRTEMRDLETKFQTLSANKQDPMLPMLMTLITQQQASAMEAVKAIQQATQTGTAAAERSQQQMLAQLQGSIMSPVQLMQMMQSMKGDAAEGSKAIIESAKQAMELQQTVFTQLLEVSGSGNQPWYAGAIQGALDRAAQITAALAERSQQQAQAAQMQQQAQPQQVRRQQVQPRQNPIQQQVGGGAAPAAIQAAPPSDARPDGAVYDKTTDEIVLLDGRRVWQPYVQQHGWRRVLSLPAPTMAREIAELRAANGAPAVAPMNGVPTSGNITAAPVTGDVLQMPAPKKPRSNRKPKVQTHEQILEMIAAMSDADPAAVFEEIGKIEDKELFGDLLLPHVQTLRTSLPAPAEVAKYVLQARGQIQGFGGTVPIALALLDAGQIQVLVERLVPEAEPMYQDACVQAIGAALEAENLGDEEEDLETE